MNNLSHIHTDADMTKRELKKGKGVDVSDALQAGFVGFLADLGGAFVGGFLAAPGDDGHATEGGGDEDENDFAGLHE
mgnify:CR=1 FL=1